jgi:hypothetical protein
MLPQNGRNNYKYDEANESKPAAHLSNKCKSFSPSAVEAHD